MRKMIYLLWIIIHFMKDSVDSVCGFWNHSLYATSGGWSTKGCIKTEVKDGLVVCECNHLTNFAILLVSIVLLIKTR